MNTSESCLDEEDAALVKAVLQKGELVELVVQPRAAPAGGRAVLRSVMGGVLLVLLCAATLCLSSFRWAAVLMFLPLWVKALRMLCSPWWRSRRGSLYLLTDHRAVVLEPRGFGYYCMGWPLYAGLVTGMKMEPDGSGSIFFSPDMLWECDRRILRTLPCGFLHVPQPERVRQMIAEQVAEVPAVPQPEPGGLFAQRGTVHHLAADGAFIEDVTRKEKEYSASPGIVLGTFLALFALVFICFAGRSLLRDMQLDQSGVPVTGRVVRVMKVEDTSSRQEHSYYPVLCFTDAAGGVHEFRSEYGCNVKEYSVGQEVALRYLPTDPGVVRLESVRGRGLWFVLFGAVFFWLGVAMMAHGVRIYLARRRKS